MRDGSIQIFMEEEESKTGRRLSSILLTSLELSKNTL
jgi:hypothetical protein